MRRGPCSTGRTGSTRTMLMRWWATHILITSSIFGWTTPETDYDAKILGQADQAIALAPENLWAYYLKCAYLYYTHRANEALSAADAGLAINPNFGPLREGAKYRRSLSRPFRTSK